LCRRADFSVEAAKEHPHPRSHRYTQHRAHFGNVSYSGPAHFCGLRRVHCRLLAVFPLCFVQYRRKATPECGHFYNRSQKIMESKGKKKKESAPHPPPHRYIQHRAHFSNVPSSAPVHFCGLRRVHCRLLAVFPLCFLQYIRKTTPECGHFYNRSQRRRQSNGKKKKRAHPPHRYIQHSAYFGNVSYSVPVHFDV